jgi:hypothetical protein
MSYSQKIFDELIEGWRAKRSLSQFTIKTFIDELKKYPENKMIESLEQPHSYRGYYSDLSFKRFEGQMPVKDLLKVLQDDCLNKTFTGYKGGDFYMDEHTPVWIADYGYCGVKIIGIQDDVNRLSFLTKEDD